MTETKNSAIIAHRTSHIANSCPQVSIHVLIYNASWERVRATLNSVIMQKDIDFDLTVFDDCSEVNLFGEIEDFFSRHSFTNYKLIAHEKNLGNVKTCLEAAQESRAEYVRLIGQGDMLFDEYTLRDSYDYMASRNADAIVTKAVFYRAFSNPIEIFAHYRFPQNIEAYNDPDTLRESYLIHDDRASGATVMYKRDVLLEYMTEAVNAGIKYLEDFMIKCMVFDKRRIFFMDRETVFYEYGAGVSTAQTNTVYRTKEISEAMSRDVSYTDDMLLERCRANPSEFSDRLAALINENRERAARAKERAARAKAKWEKRQRLKKKLGIFAWPLVFAIRIIRRIKKMFSPKKEPEQFIKTGTNIKCEPLGGQKSCRSSNTCSSPTATNEGN